VGKIILNPDLYVYIIISESYKDEILATPSRGLHTNRFLVKLGDRFSGIRNPSNYEICITTDPGRYLLAAYSKYRGY
jgi:hypothetical protein